MMRQRHTGGRGRTVARLAATGLATVAAAVGLTGCPGTDQVEQAVNNAIVQLQNTSDDWRATLLKLHDELAKPGTTDSGWS